MNTQIHFDLSTQLKAGMIVTCQLGNPTDMDWMPSAPVLLLHTAVTFFGDTQFTGLYKDPDGWHIAEMVTTHNTRDRYVDATHLDIGIAYCTCVKPFDMEEKMCAYFSDDQNKTIAQALRIHRDQVAALPEAVIYIGLKPIPIVDGAIELPPNSLVLATSNGSTYSVSCDPASPAFVAGHTAFHANKGRDTNPYPEGDVAHDQWNYGYDNDNDL